MAGRPPKEKSFANMLTIALKEADGVTLDGQPNTKLRQIADKLVAKAIEGEGWAIREVADRVDGKPMQQVEVSGEFTQRLSSLTDEQLESIAAGRSAGAFASSQGPSKLN